MPAFASSAVASSAADSSVSDSSAPDSSASGSPVARRSSASLARIVRRAAPLLLAAGLPLSALAQAQGLELHSADLREGETIAAAHVSIACGGGNQAPALEWKNVPEGTRSFAITVFDPDAPTRGGWWHWAVVNLPVATTSLERGAAPPKPALQLRNDFAKTGYSGPCPPPGKPHRYEFTVWALKSEALRLDAKAPAAIAGAMARADALGHATITVQYGQAKK